MEEVEVEKMVKLAEQCLERIKSFIGKRNETTVHSSSPTPVQASSCAQIIPQTSTKTSGEHYFYSLDTAECYKIEIQVCTISFLFLETFNKAVMDSSKLYLIEQNSQHHRVLSESKGENCPFLPPELFQKLQVMESQDNKK